MDTKSNDKMDVKQAVVVTTSSTIGNQPNTTSADLATLDYLLSRLTRASAILLVLSVLRAGRLEGLFAFLAAAFVLFCSAPGALGAARAARRTRFFAFLASVLAICSLVKYTRLAYDAPQMISAEVKMHCDAMPPDVAKGLFEWGRSAWAKHKGLEANFTGAKTDENMPTDMLHHFGAGEWHDAHWRFSQSAVCAKAEKVVRCGVRAYLAGSALLALLTLLAAVVTARRARLLMRAATGPCACGAGRCSWRERWERFRTSAGTAAQPPLAAATVPLV